MIDEYFSHVPLFESLSPEELKELYNSIKKKSLKKGEVLFKKGSKGESLFVIKEGNIKISSSSKLGDEVVLAVFSEGDYFGEMALLDGMTRSADATAMQPTTLYVLQQSDFLSFLSENPGSVKAILKSLSMRLRMTDVLLEDTCFLNISSRLAKKLVDLADVYGKKEMESIQISIPLSQRELAGMVGASRESINKELRVLKEREIITISGNKIYINDLQKLKKRIRRFV